MDFWSGSTKLSAGPHVDASASDDVTSSTFGLPQGSFISEIRGIFGPAGLAQLTFRTSVKTYTFGFPPAEKTARLQPALPACNGLAGP
jgi:hypothetical protein